MFGSFSKRTVDILLRYRVKYQKFQLLGKKTVLRVTDSALES